jgi:hypothetical protein
MIVNSLGADGVPAGEDRFNARAGSFSLMPTEARRVRRLKGCGQRC